MTRLKGIPWVCVALAALIVAAGTSPARADDYKGWFAALDIASTQPNSLDQRFANNVDFAAGRVNRMVLENDSDMTWKVSGGFGWGKMGALKVSYWSFDNEDKESGVAFGGLYPTVFGYGQIYGGQYLYNPAPTGVTFTATGKVKASTIDVDYSRPFHPGEKMSIHWLAGLRVADYEETQTFTGDDTYVVYNQDKHFKGKGWGPRMGVGLEWGFTDRFSLGGGLAFSLLQAKTDGDASQSCPSCPYRETLSVSQDNLRGMITDLDLKAIWKWKQFDVWVGYSVSDWEGIVTDPISGNDGDPGIGPTYPNGRDAISFNSIHGGIKWRFGKGS